MSGPGFLEHLVDRVKVSMSSDREKVTDYLIKYDLRSYFDEGLSQDEYTRRRSSLEEKVGQSLTKFDTELRGSLRKAGAKGSMALAVANDISAYVTDIPISNVTGLGYALFAVKTIAEMPAMYRYLKKSHDWYGAGTHYVLKPLRYVIPIIGPALESGAFERMVRKHVRSEAKSAFIKEFGNYQTHENLMKDAMRKPLSEAVELVA
jgi:hypothetical protein